MASFKETQVIPEQTPAQVAAQATASAAGQTRLYATVVEIADNNGFVRLSIDENGKLTTFNAEGQSEGTTPDFTAENPAFVTLEPDATATPVPVYNVPNTPVDQSTPGDASHSDAVAAADSAVAAAPTAPVDRTQAALDDVNAALVTYPDSTQLQDAKTQLEAQIALTTTSNTKG